MHCVMVITGWREMSLVTLPTIHSLVPPSWVSQNLTQSKMAEQKSQELWVLPAWILCNPRWWYPNVTKPGHHYFESH